MEQNNLTGTLFSDEIFELTATLNSLRASNNSFTGTIPNRIGHFVKLKELWLAATHLTGSVPLEMGNLGELGMSYN